jgi:beta-galactosidase
VELVITVRNPGGKVIHSSTQTNVEPSGIGEIVAFEVAAPQLWSPKAPQLYNCTVKLKSRHREQQVSERFGFRSFD